MKGIKRIKILSVVFVVLGIVAWFALQEKLTSDTISQEGNQIAIVDTASIKKVTIESPGKKVILSRTGQKWTVNGKYITAFRPTALMLIAFNQLQIKRPVADELKSTLYKEIQQRGEKVTIEYGEGSKVLQFLTNTNDINTTYLLKEGDSQPYVAYVPGIANNINNLFLLSENDWREKVLFATTPRTMKSIKVNYPSDAAGSFEITYSDGKYRVSGVSNLDSSNFSAYLPMYQYIPFSHYLTDKADSAKALISTLPIKATIEVSDMDAEMSNSIVIYQDPKNKHEYLGILGKTKEPVILNREVFDQLMVKKQQFIKR